MNEEFYEPGDDTYNFLKVLKSEGDFIAQRAPKVILEVGCGSGIISDYLKTNYSNALVLSSDVNYKALVNTKKIVDSEVFKSSLLQNVKQMHIDLLVFNPPYVETIEEDVGHEDMRASFSGGSHGNTVIKQFIDELKDVKLIYLLTIKLNMPEVILELLTKKGYDASIISTKKILGETICIVKGLKI